MLPTASVATKTDHLRRLMRGATTRWEESRILGMLTEANDRDLEALLRSIDLKALLSDVDDHWRGPRHRQALLELLTQRRLSALSVATRVALVRAMHQGHALRQDEPFILRIFEGTRGPALAALKRTLEIQPQGQSLHQLVWEDLSHPPHREAILNHFASESAWLSGGIKLLSDIDDTLMASFLDDRYPRGTLYPGVRSFYKALVGEEGPVFMSARPEDGAGMVERMTLSQLRALGFAGAGMVAGETLRIWDAEAIARDKTRSIRQYLGLFPEYQFIWVGDSGQGDALVARRLRREFPERVPVCFIHDVVGTPLEQRVLWAKEGIWFVDSWAGAAAQAARLGFLSAESAAQVVDCTRSELMAMDFEAQIQRLEELEREV